ncbi:MAG: ATP-binding protein, partial [Candidatus Dormibacteria bacterium]
MKGFAPKSCDRVCIVGPTGSGKSVLARSLLANREHVLVVDPKHQWAPQHGDDVTVKSGLRALNHALNRARKNGETVIYRPSREDLADPARLDEVAKMALARKNTLLYYDELVFVAQGSN